jgi:hypothetical protein
MCNLQALCGKRIAFGTRMGLVIAVKSWQGSDELSV